MSECINSTLVAIDCFVLLISHKLRLFFHFLIRIFITSFNYAFLLIRSCKQHVYRQLVSNGLYAAKDNNNFFILPRTSISTVLLSQAAQLRLFFYLIALPSSKFRLAGSWFFLPPYIQGEKGKSWDGPQVLLLR